jgi:hypothetical protein
MALSRVNRSFISELIVSGLKFGLRSMTDVAGNEDNYIRPLVFKIR